MPRLVALLHGLDPYVFERIEEVWADGDAVAVLDPTAPAAWTRRLIDALDPHRIVASDGRVEDRRQAGALSPGDALVMATSGSTGTPRAAVLSHDALDAAAALTADRLGQGPDDRWLACLPPWHIGGFSVFTRARHGGVPVVVAGRDDLAERLAGRGPDDERSTMVAVVPAQWATIDPAAWRVVLVGGAQPPNPRPANCIATYGMTETGAGIVYDGQPLPGVSVRIAGGAHDGEILVRSPTLLRSYRHGPAPIDDDGFLHTGDVGRLDAHGTLTVVGRRDLAISTGGETVLPEPVETVLATHPAVVDIAVAGRPHERWGQEVTAVVVVDESTAEVSSAPLAESLLDELRVLAADLPSYARPRAVVVVTALPRRANGKLDRPAIGRLATESAADTAPN